MRTVLLGALRAHLRRYVAVALAVGIGVAFVVVTGAITHATRDGLTAGVSAPYAGAGAVATGVAPGDLPDVRAAADRAGAEISVIGAAQVPVRATDRPSEDLYVGELPGVTDPEAPWPEVVDGRLPTSDGETLVDARAAEVGGIGLGDVLRVGEGADPLEVRVVGLSDAGPTSASNALFVSPADFSGFVDSMYVDAVTWAGPGSTGDQVAELRAALPDEAAGGVTSADERVDQLLVDANNGVDVLATMLLLFAAIALFVAVLVIANTFAILFAQRRRELALLRCVGATRRQLRRAVRLEALVVGSAATAVGMVVGSGLGVAVVALIRSVVPAAGLGEVGASWRWYAAAAVVGVLVTVVAAWLPTRRAVRVAPVAALGPDDEVRLATGAGRLRFASGLLGVGAGAALLALAVVAEDLVVMLAGGVVAFSGVVLLGPVVVPGLIRLVGHALARVRPGGAGATAALAADNAVRDPRRTSAATASLLVGVTLTTAVLVGIASTRSVTDDEMAAQHPLDATVSATASPLPADAVGRLASLEGVERAEAVPGTRAEAAGVGELTVVAPDAVADLGGLALDPSAAGRVASDELRLPPSAFEAGLDLDQPLTVTTPDGVVRLRPTYGDGVGEVAVVSPGVLARLTGGTAGGAGTGAVWLRAEPGTAGDDLAADVAATAGAWDADVTAGLANRDYVDLQLTGVTVAVVGLLGIAVVIAMAGIANTLGLSVLERTRELSLLRALGLTRGRLRATLAAEGVLLALVATLLGTAIGTAFAWVGLKVMIAPSVADAPLVLPAGQLGLVVLATAVAGLAAAMLPARRAARIAPAAGLTAD